MKSSRVAPAYDSAVDDLSYVTVGCLVLAGVAIYSGLAAHVGCTLRRCRSTSEATTAQQNTPPRDEQPKLPAEAPVVAKEAPET
jgi:hypothetical protein